MIEKLYIMYEHGSCVFEKVYYTRISAMADTQIFTGFLSAIGSFASEALGGGLQSIQLMTGEQLAIMKHGPSKIVGVCIADGRDHNKLISSLLKKILDRFYSIFKKEIDLQDASLIGKTAKFDKEVESILKNKSSSRTDLKTIMGIILGFIILGILTFGILSRTILRDIPGIFVVLANNPLFGIFFDNIGNSIGDFLVVIIFFVAIIFLIPSYVSGFISGNRTRGLISGIIITVGTYIILVFAAHIIKNAIGLDLRSWFLGLSPLIFFLTLSSSYVAGYIAERVHLYSFPKESEVSSKFKNTLTSMKEKIKFSRKDE